jgi:hypothetical protein
MAIYQASISINAVSFVGTASVPYQVDSSNTWDIGGGVDYNSSAQGGTSPTIKAVLVCQGEIYIASQGYVSIKVIKTQISAIAQNYAPEDNLTLSVDDNGDWFATLDTYFWSDLGQTSVYPGFRIVSGDGLAIITEDPQYHVRTVGVDIVSPFALWKMLPDQWNLYIPLGTDFNRSVCSPNYFRSSDLLTAYFNDIQKYVTSESQYLTHRAADLRKWNKIPADFIPQLLLTLGCYLRLDKLDDEGRRRLAYEWIRFLLYAGTRYFIDFLGYIYDTHFDVTALWTNDYRSFLAPGDPCNLDGRQGVLKFVDDDDNSKDLVCSLNDGGVGTGYYPTNHVAIDYSLDDWNIDSDYEQKSLLIDTFYKLASVPLVLEALSGKRRDYVDLYMVMVDHAGHDYFSWSPALVIASTTLYMTMVDHRHIKRSSRSPPLQINVTTLYMVMVDYEHKEYTSWTNLLQISSDGTSSLVDRGGPPPMMILQPWLAR